MRFLFLLVSLLAGAFIGWLSIVGGIWFLMPIFLICAGIVSIRLDNVVRWRILAFSVGVFVIFAVEAGQFVRGINEAERQLKNHKVKVKKPETPRGGGLLPG